MYMFLRTFFTIHKQFNWYQAIVVLQGTLFWHVYQFLYHFRKEQVFEQTDVLLCTCFFLTFLILDFTLFNCQIHVCKGVCFIKEKVLKKLNAI